MKVKERNWTRRFVFTAATVLLIAPLVYAATEAPAGFDNLTNGLTSQAQFDLDREIFDEFELIEDGLGPVYNAQACRSSLRRSGEFAKEKNAAGFFVSETVFQAAVDC